MRYQSFSIKDLGSIPQLKRLGKEVIADIQTVAEIYPFKTNNYVIEQLIDWEKGTDDPIFKLNFPHRDMLVEEHYDKIQWGRRSGDPEVLRHIVREIRLSLNPHPAGQTLYNIPRDIDGVPIEGLQHKYNRTVLYFPSHAQTCHAYCTFCFRWPQFVKDLDLKIQAKEIAPLLYYLNNNPGVSEVLITGGDPMVMSPRIFESYIDAILTIDTIKSIRIGTKSLSYWPYKLVTNPERDEMLAVLKKVVDSGRHLAIMAHFNHPVELDTPVVQEAIMNLKCIGAEIRTQAPLLRNINNKASIWAAMWEKQMQLGCVPYYMFLPRDTGAQHYFAENLFKAFDIYRNAIKHTPGLCRTVRGPVMSMTTGKVEILDYEQGVFTLRYIQNRDPELTYKVFQAISLVKQPHWFHDLACFDPRYSDFFEEGVSRKQMIISA